MNKQYKNPPIVEAVCEFKFELEKAPEQTEIDLVYSSIKSQFPKNKKGTVHRMEVKVDVKEKKEEFSKNFYSFDQFFSEDEKTLVQLDKGRLSIHRLKPYQSWEQFYSLIKLVFDAYAKNIKIKSIERIGLRYINNFEIPLPISNMEQHLNLHPAIGKGLPQDLASFMIGTIFVFEDGKDNAKVQLLNKPATISDKTIFVLDIDYFLLTPGSVSIDKVDQWLLTAHQNIENIFETALTDKTKQLFN